MTKRITISVALAMAALAGCNNGGTTNDAGNDAGMAMPVDMGGASDGGPLVDVGVDSGCMSTMPHCNTCTTLATDPYNACSSYVGNCHPFDNTRVPGWPDHIPHVGP